MSQPLPVDKMAEEIKVEDDPDHAHVLAMAANMIDVTTERSPILGAAQDAAKVDV